MFTADVDAALTEFENTIEQTDLAGSHEVWVLIRKVILSLNTVSERWELIETGEREELCQYIDDALTAAGVDLSAVASRSGIDRDEITDEWREVEAGGREARRTVARRQPCPNHLSH